MKRLVFVLFATSASAADIPDRTCAPPVQDRPAICAEDTTGSIERPAYVGPGSSLPAKTVIDSAADQDLAVCRPIADKVRPSHRATVLANCVTKQQWQRWDREEMERVREGEMLHQKRHGWQGQ